MSVSHRVCKFKRTELSATIRALADDMTGDMVQHLDAVLMGDGDLLAVGSLDMLLVRSGVRLRFEAVLKRVDP